MITISTLHAHVIPGGKLYDLASTAVHLGGDPVADATHAHYGIKPEFIPSFLTLPKALGILALAEGTTIHNYPVYIELDSVDDLVPEDLFGATYIDKDEETGEEELVHRRWSAWMLPNHHATELDGKLYIHSSAHNSKCPELSTLLPVASQLILASDLPKAESST
jgi:hypothetical protein